MNSKVFIAARRGTRIFIGTNRYPGTLLGVMKPVNEHNELVVVCYDENRPEIPAGRPLAISSSKIMPQDCRHTEDGKKGYGYWPFAIDWEDLRQNRYIVGGAGLAPEGVVKTAKNHRMRVLKPARDLEDT